VLKKSKTASPGGKSSSLMRKYPSGPSYTLSGYFCAISCAIGPSMRGCACALRSAWRATLAHSALVSGGPNGFLSVRGEDCTVNKPIDS
jgi:hypothetical protein